MEYDCGTFLGIANYCIHILSRTPTMDPAKFHSLVNQAVGMGLNTQNLELEVTKQAGCWGDTQRTGMTPSGADSHSDGST